MSSTANPSSKTLPVGIGTGKLVPVAKPFFENLDTLRFFSFMAVFLFHVHLYDYVARYTDNVFLLAVARVVCSGGWGVTFFFALSGFLITWLLLGEIKRNGSVNVGAFYMRRVLRIWPLYALATMTGIMIIPILYKIAHQFLFFDYPVALYATFLSNYGVLALDPAFNSVRSYPLVMNITWSVSIEEQFYVVWPLCFLLPSRFRKLVPVFFIVLSVGAAVVLWNNRLQLYCSSFTRVGEIAIGALFAMAAFNRDRFLQFFKEFPKALTLLIYSLSFIVIYVSYRFEWPPFAEYMLHMAGAILFSTIILEQNFSRRSIFKLGRLKLFGFLGRISYGLYMLHPIAMFAAAIILQKIQHRASPVADGPAFMIVSLVLAVGFSLLSYYTFEKQFLRLKDKFSFERIRRPVVIK